MKEELVSLLDKYYRGETTVEEEKLLRKACLSENISSPDRDLFSYFSLASEIPEDLDEYIFTGVKKQAGNRKIRLRVYQLVSIAATFALIVTGYLGYRTGQRNERDFLLIEQALYKVSETLQPEPEEPEMLVLWVDNNVEIIVN